MMRGILFLGLLLPVVGVLQAGVLFDNGSWRMSSPNGILMYGGVSAADDFLLFEESILRGGRIWTHERTDVEPASALAYWLFEGAQPTLPAGTPFAAGRAALVSKQLRGGTFTIQGIDYATYENEFVLESAVGLPAGKPLWIAVQFLDDIPTELVGAVYLWALSGESTQDKGAWLTKNLSSPANVEWVMQRGGNMAFMLEGGRVLTPTNVASPSSLLLILTGVFGFFPLVRRQWTGAWRPA
jgi:hypothetical protein